MPDLHLGPVMFHLNMRAFRQFCLELISAHPKILNLQKKVVNMDSAIVNGLYSHLVSPQTGSIGKSNISMGFYVDNNSLANLPAYEIFIWDHRLLEWPFPRKITNPFRANAPFLKCSFSQNGFLFLRTIEQKHWPKKTG